MSVVYARVATVTVDLDCLLVWLRGAVAEPVADKLVPGASPSERRRLAALGGLVRDLVPLVSVLRGHLTLQIGCSWA